MKNFNVAILGCGTVGSGVAKIILDTGKKLSERGNQQIILKTIVDLFPKKSASNYDLPLNLFCGGGKDLTTEEATKYIQEIIQDNDIHLIVETIGGTSDYLLNIILDSLKAGKHVVSANKAILAEKGSTIFQTAKENNVCIGYEASVCGAIPIIKAVREDFSGDQVQEISGIMNGTSNYILSNMQEEGLDFDVVLKMAQEAGYAEADPTLDINGGDAAHKLAILIKLAFGADVNYDDLQKEGIQNIKKKDIDFANELNCTIKLICYARKMNGHIYATVKPMMVSNSNFLSKVNGATNCVEVHNKYSGKHFLVGKGAGSLETASSIVSDIVFIAKYGDKIENITEIGKCEMVDSDSFEFPYNISFTTADYPGITGLVTTAIGEQKINIETVSHNRHTSEQTFFSLATMPCTLNQIKNAIDNIRKKSPEALLDDPVIMPILK